jgi:hypothetical protein
MDILPTLSNFLDLKGDNRYDGESLCSLFTNSERSRDTRYIISEVSRKHLCARKLSWKLIVNYSRQKKELYNLQEDPQEKCNVLVREPCVVAELEEIIVKHLDQCKVDAAPSGKIPLEQEVINQLRGLGYL